MSHKLLQKIRGIVLKTTPYSESSVVVQLLTDKFGLQSYMINGVRKPTAKIRMNMLQPLHLLDLVVYQKPNGNLQRIAEARLSPMFKTIPYDIVKSTMAVFLNEVLYKSIKGQGADEKMFEFIYHATCWLDETNQVNPNFHLAFLLKLTRHLGFAPVTAHRDDQIWFDLQEGDFTSILPEHPYYIEKNEAKIFIQLYSCQFENLETIKIQTTTRRFLLNKILTFYKLHTASAGDIKSHLILEDVLS